MKKLIFSALCCLALSAVAFANEEKKTDSQIPVKTVKVETKENKPLFDCTVTLDCGNGTSASGTASNCATAGKIAGAGCDAVLEPAEP
ncbi:hypothetical protein [Chitinophaga japonensis]|uniref:hypothetical protein n=1 Tax=Chitinophaga japonensis TaxID=104662 RepID=UPI0011A1E413|nr:hypothetical protein [Chitinophaga japonensis]